MTDNNEGYIVENEVIRNSDINNFVRIDLLQKLYGIDFQLLFYGGEVFLEFALLKKMYNYSESIAKKQNIDIQYYVITNSYDISDEVIEFIEKYSDNFKVKVSIDGIAKAHNLHRKTSFGNETYNEVIKNAKKLLKLQNDIKVATVITPSSIPYLYESVVTLNEYGFKFFEFGFESLVSKWESQQLSILEEQLLKLGEWYVEQKHAGKDIIIDEIDKKLGLISNESNSVSRCGSGEYKFFINIYGEIYPCAMANKIKSLLFGDIYNGGFFNKESLNLFEDKTLDTCDNICKECINMSSCFLKCYAINFITTGDIHMVSDAYCEVNKSVIDTCIKIGNYMYKKYPNEFKDVYHYKVDIAV